MLYFTDIIRLTKPVESIRITVSSFDRFKHKKEVLENVLLEKGEIIRMSPSGILTDNPGQEYIFHCLHYQENAFVEKYFGENIEKSKIPIIEISIIASNLKGNFEKMEDPCRGDENLINNSSEDYIISIVKWPLIEQIINSIERKGLGYQIVRDPSAYMHFIVAKDKNTLNRLNLSITDIKIYEHNGKEYIFGKMLHK